MPAKADLLRPDIAGSDKTGNYLNRYHMAIIATSGDGAARVAFSPDPQAVAVTVRVEPVGRYAVALVPLGGTSAVVTTSADGRAPRGELAERQLAQAAPRPGLD